MTIAFDGDIKLCGTRHTTNMNAHQRDQSKLKAEKNALENAGEKIENNKPHKSI